MGQKTKAAGHTPLLLVILLIYKKTLFRGAILWSYLNIYSQPLSLSLCRLAASHSFWLPLSSLACTPFHSFIGPLPIIILSLSILICYGLIHCLLHLSGGFSETYAALCDYNGIGCKEEVQWVRTLYRLYRSSSVSCAFNILLSSFAQLEKHWHRFYVTVPYLCSLSVTVSFSSHLFSFLLCSRMLTPSTTLRTTGSSIYWISAILTAGETVYCHPNYTQADYNSLACTD